MPPAFSAGSNPLLPLFPLASESRIAAGRRYDSQNERREERERSVLYQSMSIRASLRGLMFNTGQRASGKNSR